MLTSGDSTPLRTSLTSVHPCPSLSTSPVFFTTAFAVCLDCGTAKSIVSVTWTYVICVLLFRRGDQMSQFLACSFVELRSSSYFVFLSRNASFYRRGETDSVNCLFTLALDSEGGQGRDISSPAQLVYARKNKKEEEMASSESTFTFSF